jgi:hypothetical protein
MMRTLSVVALVLGLGACTPASGQLYPGTEYSHLVRDGKAGWVTVAWTDGSPTSGSQAGSRCPATGGRYAGRMKVRPAGPTPYAGRSRRS